MQDGKIEGVAAAVVLSRTSAVRTKIGLWLVVRSTTYLLNEP